MTAQTVQGSVVSIWRYPVKSMAGEELNAAEITRLGILGDRAYALVDRSDGKVASAKNPKKWPGLFDFRASFTDAPSVGVSAPAVRITLPNGAIVDSGDTSADKVLSQALTRDVALRAARQAEIESAPSASTATAEEYWPDIEGLEHRDTVTDFGLPKGTFFDAAVVHLLTTATLDRLRALYPQGRFEVRRFRPNIVVALAGAAEGFVENGWIGNIVAVGNDVRLSITSACPRCVMTTLSQSDLPRDTGILRTAAQHNHASVGVYASVVQGGTIRRGDSVSLE